MTDVLQRDLVTIFTEENHFFEYLLIYESW